MKKDFLRNKCWEIKMTESNVCLEKSDAWVTSSFRVILGRRFSSLVARRKACAIGHVAYTYVCVRAPGNVAVLTVWHEPVIAVYCAHTLESRTLHVVTSPHHLSDEEWIFCVMSRSGGLEWQSVSFFHRATAETPRRRRAGVRETVSGLIKEGTL